MADQGPKDEENNAAKLKELEKALAKELNQQVRLSEPSDSRLVGTVMVNPTLEIQNTKAKPLDVISTEPGPDNSKVRVIQGDEQKVGTVTNAATQTSVGTVTQAAQGAPGGVGTVQEAKNVDDISLGDVDDLLSQIDGDFQNQMNSIRSEVSKIEPITQNFESISIGKDYLEGEKEDKSEPTLPPVEIEEAFVEEVAPPQSKESLHGSAFSAIGKTLALPLKIVGEFKNQVRLLKSLSFKDFITGLPKAFLPIFLEWFAQFQLFFKKLLSYSLKDYFKLVSIIGLSFALYWLVTDIIVNFRKDEVKDPFLRSFSDVANEEQLIPEDDTNEDIESPLKNPEWTIQLPRMVANLKPPSPRRAPMVAVELFIEASNRDCAIEIKDRMVEVTDRIQRVLEEMTFPELETTQGKVRLKIRIRSTLNRMLNKGRVKRIFLRNLQIKE